MSNTNISLFNRLENDKTRLANKGVSKDDLARKEGIEEQCNSASENLFKKRKELQRLDQEFDQDNRKLAEIMNKVRLFIT